MNPLIDMGHGVLNIPCTMVAVTLTARSEDALDVDIYRSDNQPA
ncbi:MAG: hypothetical protein ACOCSM_01745 [Bacillota bacterium]